MFAIAADKLGLKLPGGTKRGGARPSLGSLFTGLCSILGGIIILRYLLSLTSSLFAVCPPFSRPESPPPFLPYRYFLTPVVTLSGARVLML